MNCTSMLFAPISRPVSTAFKNWTEIVNKIRIPVFGEIILRGQKRPLQDDELSVAAIFGRAGVQENGEAS